jgi:RNA polymerase sigma-70 factor (ECF subfamily)
MDPAERNLRLSRISTLWTLLGQAHDEEKAAAVAAQRALLERYGGAVHRYLLGSLRDPDAAEELFQEFACRFLSGGLRGADRGRGRFRDFVKGVLFHLVADHHQRFRRRPQPLPPDYPEAREDAPPLADEDQAFLANWRDELLARAWAALAEAERAGGQPCYTVLRFRADHPDLNSQVLAERLGAALGRRLTAAGVRQALHRARAKFADLLLDEIAQALETPTAEDVEQELTELGLLDHCRPALERRSRRGRCPV